MVEKVVDGEIENTEDPAFKAELVAAKDHVTQCMGQILCHCSCVENARIIVMHIDRSCHCR